MFLNLNQHFSHSTQCFRILITKNKNTSRFFRKKIGAVYVLSNCIITAIGNADGLSPCLQAIFEIVPIDPSQKPLSSKHYPGTCI